MDRAYIALAEAVKQHHEKQLSECCKIVSEMRPVTVASLKMIEKQKCHDEDDVEDQQEEDESYYVPKPRKARYMLTQPPQKRCRQMTATVKTCCVNGCQKFILDQKKMENLPQVSSKLLPLSCEYVRSSSMLKTFFYHTFIHQCATEIN